MFPFERFNSQSFLIKAGFCLIFSNAVFAAPNERFVLGYVNGQNQSGDPNNYSRLPNTNALALGAFYRITELGLIPPADGAVIPELLIAAAHKRGMKIYPRISNFDDTWNADCAFGAAVTNQKNSIHNILLLIRENNYDGVEIDFEYTQTAGAPSAAEFTNFIKALTSRLHSVNPNYQVIVSVPAHTSPTSDAYDYAGLAAVADYLQIIPIAEVGSGNASIAYGGSNGSEVSYLSHMLNISADKLLSSPDSF